MNSFSLISESLTIFDLSYYHKVTQHRAGFINIIGLPNVGKSSLINMLLGENLSIVTSKAQTTRQNIKGFINEDDYQMILVDTPGFIDSPAYQLQLSMNSYVELALEESDLLLLVVDKFNRLDPEHPLIVQIVKSKLPLVLIINKSDQSTPEEILDLESYYRSFLNIGQSIPISAELKIGRDQVIQTMLEYIPESPPYFSKEEYTDRTMRFMVSEIIRQKIFENYQKEIPYSTEVVIQKYEDRGDGSSKIEAIIYVERDSQKNIIIGHQAEKLKAISMAARKKIEEYTDATVHLFIFVKVLPQWRSRDNILKKFGYHIKPE